MADETRTALSAYRMEHAYTCLAEAELMLKHGMLKGSVHTTGRR